MERLKVIVAMATKNDCYKNATPAKMGGIIVHSTAANNPYLKRYIDAPAEVGVNNYGNTWNNPASVMGRYVAVHAFIGYDINHEIRVAQMLPYNIACWGNGSTSTGNCNFNPNARIQFEMCEDNRQNKAFLTAMLEVATQYCAELCLQFGWDPLGMYNGAPVIMDHAESYQYRRGGNHSDVGYWLKPHGYSMDWFRNEVKRKLDILKGSSSEPEKPTAPSGDFKVGDIVNFKGGPHYSSSQSVAASSVVTAGKAMITNIAVGKKHPYHLVGKKANAGSVNSNVFGWVDANLISKTSQTIAPSKKSNEEIAREVLKGKWGNGQDRKDALTKAGYDYSIVQAIVDSLVNGSKPAASSKPAEQPKPASHSKKSNEEIAKEVFKGKWGNGADRRRRLEAAGYNYDKVQSIVNSLVNGSKPSAPPKKSIDEIAREVIRGNWGNGADRRRRLEAAGYNYSEVQARVNQLL